jgi:hypothetical protein
MARIPASAPMTMPALAAPLMSPESLSLGFAVADGLGVLDVSAKTKLLVVGVVVGAIIATVGSSLSVAGLVMTDGNIAEGSGVDAPACLRFILGGLSGDAASLLSAWPGTSMSLTSCFTTFHKSRAAIVLSVRCVEPHCLSPYRPGGVTDRSEKAARQIPSLKNDNRLRPQSI